MPADDPADERLDVLTRMRWARWWRTADEQRADLDPAAVPAIRRWVRIVIGIVLVVDLAVIALMVVGHRLVSALVLGGLALLVSLVFVRLLARKHRYWSAFATPTGACPAFVVDRIGIHLPSLVLPWDSVVAVFVIDERPRITVADRRGGPMPAIRRLMQRAGRSVVHMRVVVRDGESFRAGSARPLVTLWTNGGGPRWGEVEVGLDNALDEPAWTAFAAATVVAAEQRGIRTSWTTGAADQVRFMGRLADVFDGWEDVDRREALAPFVAPTA